MTDPKALARRTVRNFLEQMAEANEHGDAQRTPEATAEVVRLFRAAATFIDAGGEFPPTSGAPVEAAKVA